MPEYSGPQETKTRTVPGETPEVTLRGDLNLDGYVNLIDYALAADYLGEESQYTIDPQGLTNFAAAWDNYDTIDQYDAEAILYMAKNDTFLGYNPAQCADDITVSISGPDTAEINERVTFQASIDSHYQDTWARNLANEKGIRISPSDSLTTSFGSPGTQEVNAIYESDDTICQYYAGKEIEITSKLPELDNQVYLPFMTK